MYKSLPILLAACFCSVSYAQVNQIRFDNVPQSTPDIQIRNSSATPTPDNNGDVTTPTDETDTSIPVENREWEILATFGTNNANSTNDTVMGRDLNSRAEILDAGFTFDPSPEKLNYISSPDRSNWINFYYGGNAPAGLNFTVPHGVEQVKVYYGTSFYSNDRQHIVELKHNGVTIDSVTEGRGLQSSTFTFNVSEGDTVTLYEQWSVMAVNTIWVR